MKLRLITALAGLLIFVGNSLFAGSPTTEPILKINTKMHVSQLMRVGSDSYGRYVVTASMDKVAMLWDGRTGQLIRVLRPPIDAGNEGKLYCAAISPDGSIVAAAGWTGWDWQGSSSIYIFNTSTGKMIKRVTGLPSVINDVEFSQDGKYLAAAMHSGWGVNVYNTSNWSMKKEIRGHGKVVYNSAFDKNGRLATVCYDGYLRLFDSNFNLLKEQILNGGSQPFSLAFSPDGSKIALGYSDSTNVEVYDGYSLAFLFKPDLKETSNLYNVEMVTWSRDGKYLYAGAWYQKNIAGTWWCQIRRWDNGGRGAYKDLNAAKSLIMDIKTMPDDSILYGSFYPDFGRMDKEGRSIYYRSGEMFNFNIGNKNHLKVSSDGSVVSYAPTGKGTFTFDINKRELSKTESYGTIAMTSRAGVTVTDWENNSNVKVNGVAANFLSTGESNRSVSISKNGDYIVCGADWAIYGLDRTGKKLWGLPAPGTAWAVNIADDKDVVVIAYGDGTIRWHDIRTGRELVAFFPHNDEKRWVVWTPSGYYDASIGGQDLIGWHINNGENNEADFYPASRFADRFYRPDIIALVLKYLDEGKAVAEANKEKNIKTVNTNIKVALPPIVTILSPLDRTEISSTTVKIKYIARSPSSAPVTNVKILIDGRPVPAERNVNISGKGFGSDAMEISVTIPEKSCSLSLIAENKNAASEPAVVNLVWKGKKTDEFIIKPKLYVLAIGVSEYENKTLALKFAAKDARDFGSSLIKQKGGLYRDVVVKIITDREATRDNILDSLDWIQKETTSKDVAMVFLAGHGVNDSNGIYYYLPVNADTEKLKRTCVPFSDIKNTITTIAGKALFFVDTCHSGNIMGARRGPADISGVVNELSSAENGVVVFASSTGSQYSLEDAAWGNGAFTKALIEGIGGKADYTGKGKISINMLDLYISERVKELTKGRQTPTTTKPHTVPDFPISAK